MWTYKQSTGELTADGGSLLAIGYSGHGDGVNDPDLQNVPDVGPIPQGLYDLGSPVNDPENPDSADPELLKLGPYAIPLTPHADNQMFGRSGFFCHGDDVHHLGERVASEGCIIMSPGARHRLWESGDHTLQVVA